MDLLIISSSFEMTTGIRAVTSPEYCVPLNSRNLILISLKLNHIVVANNLFYLEFINFSGVARGKLD